MLTALDIFSKVTNAVPVDLNFVLRFFFTRSSASLNCLSKYSNASNFDPNQRGRMVGRARCGTTSFGWVECPPSGSVSVKTPPVLSGSYSSTVLGLPTKPVQDSSNFKSALVRLSSRSLRVPTSLQRVTLSTASSMFSKYSASGRSPRK